MGADRTQLIGLTGLAGVPGADVVAGRAQTVETDGIRVQARALWHRHRAPVMLPHRCS